jgi:prepilin peptidase CpaA
MIAGARETEWVNGFLELGVSMGPIGYQWAMMAVLVPATMFAGWTDYRSHRVPNLLTAFIVVAGLVAQGWFNGRAGILAGVEGVLVGFGLLIGLWLLRGMGAGDVKLMAALGAWLGPALTLAAVAVAGILGGVMALAIVARQRAWAQMSTNVGAMVVRMGNWKDTLTNLGSAPSFGHSTGVIPYAIPLCIGTWLVVANKFFGWWEVL